MGPKIYCLQSVKKGLKARKKMSVWHTWFLLCTGWVGLRCHKFDCCLRKHDRAGSLWFSNSINYSVKNPAFKVWRLWLIPIKLLFPTQGLKVRYGMSQALIYWWVVWKNPLDKIVFSMQTYIYFTKKTWNCFYFSEFLTFHRCLPAKIISFQEPI